MLASGARHPDDAPDPAVFSDARAVLEWAADHAADLDADPRRLLVAGAGPGRRARRRRRDARAATTGGPRSSASS